MTLRALLLDAHGTLIETREPVGESYARIAAAHGVQLPAWRLDDAFRRVIARAEPLTSAGADWTERVACERAWWRARVRETFRATDQTVVFDDFDACFDALFAHYAGAQAWQLRPGAAETLTAARTLGLGCAVVSNFDHRLPKILEALGIASEFEFVGIPALGLPPKPAPDLLCAALRVLEVTPSQALYVGDEERAALDALSRASGIDVLSVAELGGALHSLPERLRALATL